MLASIAAGTVEDGEIPDRVNSGNQEDAIEGQPGAESASNDADSNGGNAETSSSDDPLGRTGQAERARAEDGQTEDGQTEDGQTESGTDVAAPEEHMTVFTPTVATVRQRSKPKKKQIETAFLEAAKANAQQLLEPDVPSGIAQLQPLTVFTRIEVGRIRIKGERGSVKLKLAENMSLEQGRVLPGKTIERELSIGRRNQDGSTVWVITDPAQRTYLLAAQALTIFAHEAEIMLRRAPNAPATRALVKALDLLYDQQPAHPESAELQ
ncbi:MAG TPA: hypothetical protein VFP59_02675 [Candidatus Angelobacter sp.]|nr:hypothetical protein [Candidatus Angelobacter sp.]